MSQPETGPRRGRDLERLLTFVDAVVAIAITLLVLPLVELTSEVTEHDSVATVLRTHQPLLWSFLLSFAVISRLWFAQHYSLRHVLLPTALVARAGDQATTKILYIGTIALSTVTLALMDRVIVRNPQITDGLGFPAVMPAVVNTLLLGLALVISLAIPALSYFPMLLLFLDRPVRSLLARFRRGA